MRFFTVLDFHHLVLAFFLGLVGALIVYLSFRYGTSDSPDKDAEPIDAPPALKEAGDNPMPPVLVFLYAAVFISILLYVLFYILGGRPF